MKINKVSKSNIEADLFNSLYNYNLKKNKNINKNIKKEALLPLVGKLIRLSAMITGGVVATKYATQKYFEAIDTPDFSEMFAENENVRTNFARLSNKISDHAKESSMNFTIFFSEVSNYETNGSAPAEEEAAEEEAAEEEAEEESEESDFSGSLFGRSILRTGNEYNYLIKKESSDKLTEKAKKAVKFFEENNFNKKLADYVIAHEQAQRAASIFNILSPALNVLSLDALFKIASGQFDEAFATSIGSAVSGIKGKIRAAKQKANEAITAYEDLSDTLFKHLLYSKVLARYARKKHKLIQDLATKDGITYEDVNTNKQLFVRCTEDFHKLLDHINNFFEAFKEILAPFTQRLRVMERLKEGQRKYRENPFINEKRLIYKERSGVEYKDVHLKGEEKDLVGGYRITMGSSSFTIKNLKVKFPVYTSSSGVKKPLYDETTNKLIWKSLFEKEILSPRFKKNLFGFEKDEYESDNAEQSKLFEYFEDYGFTENLYLTREWLKNYLKKLEINSGEQYSGSTGVFSEYDDAMFQINPTSYINCLSVIGDIFQLARQVDNTEGASRYYDIKKKLEEAFSLYLSKYIGEWFMFNNKKLLKHTEGVRKRKLKSVDEARPKFSGKNKNNLEKNSQSINNKELVMKNANYSDQYYADAVSGLNNSDPLLKEFYSSMKQETLRRSELRDDRENLKALEESQDTTSMAHPKSIRLSDGHGDGGLVENGHEQKEKSLEVAKRNPTGNFVGRYAWVRDQLKK